MAEYEKLTGDLTENTAHLVEILELENGTLSCFPWGVSEYILCVGRRKQADSWMAGGAKCGRNCYQVLLSFHSNKTVARHLASQLDYISQPAL